MQLRYLKYVFIASLAASGVAVAQTTPPPAQNPPTTDQAQTNPAATPDQNPAAPGEAAPVAGGTSASTKKSATEEIVVTGTRVRRKDLNTPAPVTVLSRDQITASGKISIGEFLQSLPEQGNTVNAQVNNGNDGSIRVALRSLGSQRTLVLVNGRRMVPGGTGADSSADLATIPAAAIERIEVLKDGASAIYGSDAISGVVNVILRKRFNGTEVGGYAGVSQHGDGQTYDVHALSGTAGDRSSILISLGYQEQRPVYAADREFSNTTYNYDFDAAPAGQPVDSGSGCFADPNTEECVPKAQSSTGNSSTFPNGRFSIPASACGSTDATSGVFTANPAVASHPQLAAICAATKNKGGGFMADAPRDQPGSGPASGFIAYPGDLYNTNAGPSALNYLITPARRIQVFSTGDVNLGNAARAFFEASYVNRTSSQILSPMPLVNSTIPTQPVTVSKDSIYNPFGVNITSWRIRTTEFGFRYWSQDLDTFRVVAGLDGSLGDWSGPLSGWAWDVDYNHGRTAGNQLETGQLRMPNVANATGPSGINPSTGQAVCLRSVANPGGARVAADFAATNIIAGCVPFDVLHGSYPGQVAAKNYVSYDGTDFGTDQQDIWSANLSGDLFKLGSERPVGLAVGADYRRESASFQNNPINSGESSGNNALSTNGGYNVKEVYGELVIPLLGGMPFVEDLELQGAARYVDYSTFGNNTTYKLGARYSPFRDLTVRATYGTAFRAPTVAELYGGAADNYPGLRDPCRSLGASTDPGLKARCVANGVPATGSGDPSTQLLEKISASPTLGPETATTFTAGLVLQPRMVRNLSITLDYYNLSVAKSIATLGASYVVSQCYVTGNDPSLCPLIIRDTNGLIEQINDPRANTGNYHTTGIDFAIRYAQAVEDLGRFSFILDGTYLNSYRFTDISGNIENGAGNYDLGALPKWKANAGVFWTMGALGVGVSGRYVGGFTECFAGGDFLCSEDSTQQHRISAYLPVDAFVSYTLRDWVAGTTSMVVGVQNIADVQPPFIAVGFAANSDPSTYDYIGRFVYARLTHTF
ncbi:MAG: TonB-dependent receptor plug domain-containing protein [Myxococcales bacterium]